MHFIDDLHTSLLAVCIEHYANDPVKHEEALSKLKENGISKKALYKPIKKSISEITKMFQPPSDEDIFELMNLRRM